MRTIRTAVEALEAFLLSTRAQGILEYAIIVAVIAIACFSTLVLMGHALNNAYGLQNKVNGF